MTQRLIDANVLNKHKFLSPQVKVFGGRHNGKTKEQIIQAYQIGWNDCIDAIIANAPTVEYPFYAEAYQAGYEEGKNDRPKGKWKVNNYGNVYCSNCGIMALCKEFMADDFREVKTDYCAFCGADMRGEKDE